MMHDHKGLVGRQRGTKRKCGQEFLLEFPWERMAKLEKQVWDWLV